jgi:hypothetical protein
MDVGVIPPAPGMLHIGCQHLENGVRKPFARVFGDSFRAPERTYRSAQVALLVTALVAGNGRSSAMARLVGGLC